ncbi:hypothetical protein TPB0596_12330 [Tsukamurella pulmonis]|uniref:terminase large subunit domain-containing protein n=1 Tax=Tsukamurella pulmonis TaxID=47312 RepID=UPI001EDE6E54|nr:terminase family protein [Tsukamurella pulmonis]BDD81470.1 hypothetical protein TPB0596_12330 [Tsukamurella pulmonis]
MTSAAPWWKDLPDEDKHHLIAALREQAARAGRAASTVESPVELATTHDRYFNVRAHTEVIDDALVWTEETPDAALMIWTPPQVGKSALSSRIFPAWWLSRRPRDRIALASYALSLAAGHGAWVRDWIRAYGPEYGLHLSDSEATRTDWTLTTGGGLRARGVGGGLTGHPVDIGIIDDPYKDREQAESETIRDKVWDWYSSVFLSRMSPGARQAVIMTRWHQDDLCGRLLQRDGRIEEGGKWRVVHLPAIAVAPDHTRGFYADPLGREPGEPLTHPKLTTRDDLERYWAGRRAITVARDWNSMYQGVPYDAEGALLTDDDIRDATVTTAPAARRVAVAIDPSGGGRDTAGIVAGLLGTNGKVYITHDRTARMTSDRWSRTACLLAVEADADRIIVEKNFGGDMAKTLIRQAWDQLQREHDDDGQPLIPPGRLCPNVHEVVARRSKVLRAEPIAQAVKTGRVKFLQGLTTVTSEFSMWEPGSTWSPGALDAAVHLATDLLPPIAAGATITSVAKRKRDDTGRGGSWTDRRRA